jgi:hypothetical protein
MGDFNVKRAVKCVGHYGSKRPGDIGWFVKHAIRKAIFNDDNSSSEEDVGNNTMSEATTWSLNTLANLVGLGDVNAMGSADRKLMWQRFTKLFEGYAAGISREGESKNITYIRRDLTDAIGMYRVVLQMIGVNDLEGILPEINEAVRNETFLSVSLQSSKGNLGMRAFANEVAKTLKPITLKTLIDGQESGDTQVVPLKMFVIEEGGDVQLQSVESGDVQYEDEDGLTYKIIANMQLSSVTRLRQQHKVASLMAVSNAKIIDNIETINVIDDFIIMKENGMPRFILCSRADTVTENMYVSRASLEQILKQCIDSVASTYVYEDTGRQLGVQEYVMRMLEIATSLAECCTLSYDKSMDNEIETMFGEGNMLNVCMREFLGLIRYISKVKSFNSDNLGLKAIYERSEDLPTLMEERDPLLVHMLAQMDEVKEPYTKQDDDRQKGFRYIEDDAMQQHVFPVDLNTTKRMRNIMNEVYKRNSSWAMTSEGYFEKSDIKYKIESDLKLSNALMRANISNVLWAAISDYKLSECLERVWEHVVNGATSPKKLPLGNRDVYHILDAHGFGYPLSCYDFDEGENNDLKGISYRQKYVTIGAIDFSDLKKEEAKDKKDE